VINVSLEKWIKDCEKTLEEIKKFNPKDRLELVSSIAECNMAIKASAVGWQSWLTSPIVMKEFSKEELEAIFNKFKELTIEFLTLDIKNSKHIRRKAKRRRKKTSSEYIS